MATGERHKLFVGNLPQDVTQDEMRELFGAYGNACDVHVMQGKATSGQGCAFIVFDLRESAESAIAALDGASLLRGQTNSQPIHVSWARPGGASGGMVAAAFGGYGQAAFGGGYGVSPFGGGFKGGYGKAPATFGMSAGWGAGGKGLGMRAMNMPGLNRPPPPAAMAMQKSTKLFVGNLPPDVTPEVLTQIFGTYGNVSNTHLMAGKAKSGQSCAFVEYATPLEAETAVLTLHEKYEIRPGDGFIVVKYANAANPRSFPY